jgi:hypothetical protein
VDASQKEATMQSATPSHLYNPDPFVSRGMVLQLLLGFVAAGLFAAFWVLCSNQVVRGEERQAELRVRQMAFAECLQAVPRSTFASCRVRMVAASPETIITSATPVTGTMPVSYQVR